MTEENAGPTLDSVLSWAPGEAAWREEPPAPQPMRQFCSATIGSTIYSVGSSPSANNAFTTVSQVW